MKSEEITQQYGDDLAAARKAFVEDKSTLTSILKLAFNKEQYELAQDLLADGADLTKALTELAEQNDWVSIKKGLSELNKVNKRYPHTLAALFQLACKEDNPEHLIILLENGLDAHAVSKPLGNTPMVYAALSNKAWRVVLKLATLQSTKNADSNVGLALYYAAQFEQWVVVDKLLDMKAPMNMSADEKFFAIHFVILKNRLELLSKMIANGIDLTLSPVNGKTPLDYAEEHKNGEAIQLIKSGATFKKKIRDLLNKNESSQAIQFVKENYSEGAGVGISAQEKSEILSDLFHNIVPRLVQLRCVTDGYWRDKHLGDLDELINMGMATCFHFPTQALIGRLSELFNKGLKFYPYEFKHYLKLFYALDKQAKCEIKKIDPTVLNVLFEAIVIYHPDCEHPNSIIESWIPYVDLTYQNKQKKGFLQIAIENKKFNIADCLLSHKTPFTLIDDENNTAITAALTMYYAGQVNYDFLKKLDLTDESICAMRLSLVGADMLDNRVQKSVEISIANLSKNYVQKEENPNFAAWTLSTYVKHYIEAHYDRSTLGFCFDNGADLLHYLAYNKLPYRGESLLNLLWEVGAHHNTIVKVLAEYVFKASTNSHNVNGGNYIWKSKLVEALHMVHPGVIILYPKTVITDEFAKKFAFMPVKNAAEKQFNLLSLAEKFDFNMEYIQSTKNLDYFFDPIQTELRSLFSGLDLTNEQFLTVTSKEFICDTLFLSMKKLPQLIRNIEKLKEGHEYKQEFEQLRSTAKTFYDLEGKETLEMKYQCLLKNYNDYLNLLNARPSPLVSNSLFEPALPASAGATGVANPAELPSSLNGNVAK